jgi:hypothetical protein
MTSKEKKKKKRKKKTHEINGWKLTKILQNDIGILEKDSKHTKQGLAIGCKMRK